MPRYRFRWENLPAPLVASLVGEDDGDAGPLERLREWYGVRPSEALIRDAWPVLLQHWLAGDDRSREVVVAAMRSRQVGAMDLDVTDHAGQMTYLGSLRNTAGLRAAVLRELIRLGERSAEELGHLDDVGDLLDRAAPLARPGLGRLAGEIAATLAHISSGQVLVISRRGTNRYVRVVVGDEGAWAESTGDVQLNADDELTTEQRAALEHLGWEPPDGASAGYRAEWSVPVPFGEVGVLAVRTLERAHGVTEPHQLQYAAFEQGGTEILLPQLGLERASPRSRPDVAPPLVEQIDELLTSVVPAVERLDDSFVVPFGSTMVDVRPVGSPPFIAVRAPVLLDAEVTEPLRIEIHRINSTISFARLLLVGTTVSVQQDVLASELEHLVAAVGHVGRIADELDEVLRERFGGRTLFGTRRALPRLGDAGYL